MIEIYSKGAEVVSTNYWRTEHAEKGYFYLSLNAGCFRLLVPEPNRAMLTEMRTAREVIVSRGPWPEQGRTDALEILFEDGTNRPFALHLGVEQVDRLPLATDVDKPGQPPRWKFAAWTPEGNQLELPCRYRIVSRIPCLETFREEVTQ